MRVQIRKKENPAAEIKDEKSFWNTLLNNGKWRAMENEWKKELKAGKKVEVEIQIIYDNKNFSKRPQKFVVNTTTTDSLKRVEYSTYEFYN